jgi:drug/metabolite transporter (DMT)-like permease
VTTSSIRRDAIRTAPLIGVALVAGGAALWGLDAVLRQPLVAAGPGQWSAWTIVLYEHVILSAIAVPYLVAHRDGLRRLSSVTWGAALVVGWEGSALATLAFTRAFAISGANYTVVILLQKTQPLWAIAAAAVVVRERPLPSFAPLLVPAAIGTYLLSFGWTPPGAALDGAQSEAVALALIAAALWGSATAFGRLALREVAPDVLTGLRFTLALPLLLGIAAWEGALGPPSGAPGGDWLRLPAIALVPGLVAMVLYYRGLRTTPAPIATIAELAFPATALVVNYLFLDVTLRPIQVVGFAILWATILVLHRVPVRLPAEPAPPVALAGGR